MPESSTTVGPKGNLTAAEPGREWAKETAEYGIDPEAVEDLIAEADRLRAGGVGEIGRRQPAGG